MNGGPDASQTHAAPPVVVVGLDGSTASLGALRAALEYCAKTRARLHIVHVVEAPLAAAGPPEGTPWTQMLPAMQERARGAVGVGVRYAEDAGLEHRVAILVAHDAAAGIVREAEAVGATLVVVGSHGRTGIRRIALGSVAERVVRLAHCAVLVGR